MLSIINNSNNIIFPYYTTVYKFYNKLIKYNYTKEKLLLFKKLLL